MKNSEFCEKEFEILFCREFLNVYKCDFYFPSQRKEVIKGFDARFKHKVFKAAVFQFKIVTEYVRNPFKNALSAYGFATHKSKGNLQIQHNKLVMLNRKGIKALYLVPCFIGRNNLITYVRSNTLMQNCCGLKPIYTLTPGNHSIKFDKTRAAQFCSEEQRIQINQCLSFEDSQEIVYDELNLCFEENKKENLFEILSQQNLVMMYKILN